MLSRSLSRARWMALSAVLMGLLSVGCGGSEPPPPPPPPPAVPTRLVFLTQPETRPVRGALPEVRVRLVDARGNAVPAGGPAVTLSLRGGTATLGGSTTVAPVEGVASFSGLTVDAEGTGYTLVASAQGLVEATSDAFDILDTVAPAAPVLVAGATTRTTAEVQWDAVGDDGLLGTATEYELRYATTPIVTDADFAAATRFPTGAPRAAGTRETVTLTGLALDTTYSVALRVTDNAGNASRSTPLQVATRADGVTRLAFRPEPAGGVAGEPLTVQVALLDSNGAVVTDAISTVTLTLSGDATRSWTARPENGVASFSGVRIDQTGTYVFNATIGPPASATSAPFTLRSAPVSRLRLSGLTEPVVAGSSRQVEVAALDAFGNLATDYTGTVRFTSTDAAAVLPPDTTYSAVDGGRGSFTVALRTAGRHTVTVTDGTRTDSLTVDVRPGAAASLALSGLPASVTAGSEQSVTVTARDAWGNTATGYGGTVAFTASDARAELPAPAAFTPEDAGQKTFRVRFLTASASDVTLQARDTQVAELSATATTRVEAAAPVALVLSAPESATAGQGFEVSVTAEDAFGNRATGYTGTVRFTATRDNATLPPETAFTAADAGRRTFSGVVLRRAGRTELTVTDTVTQALTSTAAVQVAPSAPARLDFTAQPSSTRVRAELPEVRVAVLDAFDNVTPVSSPAVSLALAGGGAGVLGGTPTATPSDGVAVFRALSVDEEGLGYTLRATADGLDAGLSTPFDVVDDVFPARPVLRAVLRSPTSITLEWEAVGDDGDSGRATAYELRYATTPIVTDEDFAAATRLEVDPPGTPGTPESAVLRDLMPVTPYHVALAVTDSAGNTTRSDTLTASTVDFVVARLAFTRQPADGVAGAPLAPVEVSLLDAEGRVATTSTAAVTLTPSGPSTESFTVNAVRGVATFSGLVLQRASTGNTFQATSGALPAETSAAFDIRPAAAAGLVLSGLTSPVQAGVSQSVTVTAYDAFGNVATGYTGTVRFFSTDAAAGLPADTTFTAGDAGRRDFSLVLRTAGAREVQVVDTLDAALADVGEVTVTPAEAERLVLAGGVGPLEVGTAFAVEVTARDRFGNVATGYTGTVRFSASDGSATLPDDTAFTAEDRGQKVLSGLRLRRAGPQTVTATDITTGLTGSLELELTPGPAVSMTLSPERASTVAGQRLGLVVSLFDTFGNAATGYTGTVRFSSTDPRATLPEDFTFSAADAGQRRFEGTWVTAGTREVGVVDLGDNALSASASVSVTPDAPARLAFTAQPTDRSVRAALETVRVEVLDAYDNTVPVSAPAVRLELSGGNPLATLQGQTLVSPVEGVASFSGLSVDQEGGFVLSATAEGLTAATSAPFTIVDDQAPALPTLTFEPVTSDSIGVVWSAVGDDGLEGVASTYDLRYSQQPLATEADWENATRLATPPPPPPGTGILVTVSELTPSTRYYFGLEVRDSAGNTVRALADTSTAPPPDPCTGVVCEPPAPTCTTDARSVVASTAACRVVDGAGVCETAPPTTTRCAVGEVCGAGACVPVAADTQVGTVVITELRVLGSEFIELRNTTAGDIDLRGFTFENAAGQVADIRAITDLDGSAGTPVIVPAGGSLHGVANPADGVVPAGAGFVYGSPGTGFSLADTGDRLELSALDELVEDRVDFRSFVTDPNQPLSISSFVGHAGATTQLDPSRLGATANDDARSWCVTFYPASGPRQRVSDTAGAANGSCGVAVINEVLIDPVSSDDATSFIEIAGPGGAMVGGLQISDIEGNGTSAGSLNTDGDRETGEIDGIFVIPAGTRIPADGILLIADMAPSLGGITQVPNFVPGVDVLARDVDFENGGRDAIQLFTSTGVLLDAVGTDSQGDPLSTNRAVNNLAMYETATALYPPINASLARSPVSADSDNNRADFRGDPTPTPGRPNDEVRVTVTSITPNNSLASLSTDGVVITGTDLPLGSGVFFGSLLQSATCTIESNATRMTCTAPANGGLPAVVDVTLRPGASVSPEVVVSRGFTYTGVLNDRPTPAPDEADFCNLQFPPSLTVGSGQRTGDLYARIYEAGLTDTTRGQAAPGIRAELGFGPLNTNPLTNTVWRFFPATFNTEVGNDDEYGGTLLAPVVTVSTQFRYTSRFTRDNGLNWTYCDLNGAGSNFGLNFESTQLGLMTVNP
jgi:hypothetical protein